MQQQPLWPNKRPSLLMQVSGDRGDDCIIFQKSKKPGEINYKILNSKKSLGIYILEFRIFAACRCTIKTQDYANNYKIAIEMYDAYKNDHEEAMETYRQNKDENIFNYFFDFFINLGERYRESGIGSRNKKGKIVQKYSPKLFKYIINQLKSL